jgi:ribosomal protein S18 acetylase RimI-like enzyme
MAILSGSERLLEDVIVRPAQPGDENAVLDLLGEAATWLDERGIEQWPRRFPVTSVQRQIAAGRVLLVGQGSHSIATVAVAESDTGLWGPDIGPAYYISRLAVARRASGANLGYRIIDWVSSKAAARGWPYVRLATASNNSALWRYYERAGFQHVADPPTARWPTSLYERKTSGTQRRPLER